MTNTLRKIALGAMLGATAITTVTMTSCKKDETCNAGYEGSDCKTEVRSKFIGTWTASETTGTKNVVYTVPVTAGTQISSVIIGSAFSDNFFDNNINATVSGTTITIPAQQPDNTYTVQGEGTITNGKITINYTLTQPVTNATQNYTGTWSK